jgi:hypothetical protein
MTALNRVNALWIMSLYTAPMRGNHELAERWKYRDDEKARFRREGNKRRDEEKEKRLISRITERRSSGGVGSRLKQAELRQEIECKPTLLFNRFI